LVKVSIIEDDKNFRESLEYLINGSEEFRIHHSYASAEDAIRHIIEHPPQIAIVDIKLPGKNGIELIHVLKNQMPDTQFMICSYYDDNEYIFNALKNGAVGYILKDARPEEILESLDELNKGGAPMSRYIAKKVVMVFQNKPQQHKLAELTTRENEILNKVSTGININELADSFSISPLTVKCHLRNIYSKLHVTNRVEAINKLNNNSNDRNFF
jgi:NarL family two-component system response regulator LiaR